MSVLGVGTDIVELSRIEKINVERGQRLARRILTEAEFVEFQVAKRPANFLAKRFAAKEAAAKALGTGIAQGVGFQDMEVFKADTGQPLMRLKGGALTRLEMLGAKSVHLSLSDDAGLVLAFVVLST